MNRHQFGAVGKGGLYLDLVYHFGNAFHDVVSGEDGSAELHQFRHTAAIAGSLLYGC